MYNQDALPTFKCGCSVSKRPGTSDAVGVDMLLLNSRAIMMPGHRPYTKSIRHGFKKLAKLAHQHFNKLTLLKTKAQEMLKNNEITNPVATMNLDLGTCSLPFANAIHNLPKVFNFLKFFLYFQQATAWIGFSLIFIIKLLSAVSNVKLTSSTEIHSSIAIRFTFLAKFIEITTPPTTIFTELFRQPSMTMPRQLPYSHLFSFEEGSQSFDTVA
ncbi:LOW QUALITY PROTEIN: hypothetical protein HID58_006069 [Brassica napus]|uniref:Uncharacterized protein n=1 Tax=Brassica napus TaxID=3708 RepID=A0ABQ8EAB8_BRANA|nr:LOW QUALITY PROTEIN: hypothetical protein HID58_006069 [Brassica napus]